MRGRLKKTETCPCSSPGLGRFKRKPPPSPCHPAASPGAYAPITHKTVATVYAHDRRPTRRWHRWPPLPRPPAPSPSQSLFSGLVGHTTRRICVRMVLRPAACRSSLKTGAFGRRVEFLSSFASSSANKQASRPPFSALTSFHTQTHTHTHSLSSSFLWTVIFTHTE